MAEAEAVKEKLAVVGITRFPNNSNDLLWNDIKLAVDPPLTIQELIDLKNYIYRSVGMLYHHCHISPVILFSLFNLPS